MISSKAFIVLEPIITIIRKSLGKTIGEIKNELSLESTKMKKGASGLIVETMLGIKNNNNDEPDIPEIECEIKVLPIQKKRNGEINVKEPTQIQMINYCQVAKETWETAKIKRKIKLTLWIVYLARYESKSLPQDEYKIVDFYIDHPSPGVNEIFKKDWEDIQSYIVKGLADRLSCSMGKYIEPKTKGANNRDLTIAPDGRGGHIKVRRRAFYYKKNYTNSQILPNLDFGVLK